MVEKKLLAILNEVSNMGIDEMSFNKAASLVKDFGFDSVKMVEMIVAIETEFDICIDDDDLDLEKLDSIENLVRMIKRKAENIGNGV